MWPFDEWAKILGMEDSDRKPDEPKSDDKKHPKGWF